MLSMGDDLIQFVNEKQTACLNEAADHTLAHALATEFRADTGKFLQSDADAQLLIHVVFKEKVKISGIKITAPAESGPASLKFFANSPSMDFSEADDEKGTEVLPLTAADLLSTAKPIALRYVIKAQVEQLWIFVPCNLSGTDNTVIQRIQLLGKPAVSHEGSKPSAAQQKAAQQADWMNSQSTRQG